eukprot:9433566-Pyramimonas_sp.AAC.1
MLEFTPGFIAERAKEAALVSSDVLALARIEKGWRGALRWGPLNHLLSRGVTGTWTPRHKAALRSLVGGSHWPQARLFRHGKAQHARCLICGGQGTLFHRFCECPCIEAHRREECPPHVRAAARKVSLLAPEVVDMFAR